MTKNILITVAVALVVSLGVVAFTTKNGSVGSISEMVTKTNYLEAVKAVIHRSPDGYVLYDDFSIATTTPVRATLTNAGPEALMCDGSSLAVYMDATADFAPSIQLAIGTSTSAAYSANLVASSTIATSTDTVLGKVSWPFLLAKGSSVTVSAGDYVAAIASSTYYGNWAGEVSIHCWSLGE